MNSFNPQTFNQAASQFVPRPDPRMSPLETVAESISALRSKGATLQEIATLLAEHGLDTSKSTLGRFCRQVLGDPKVRRKRAYRKRRKLGMGADAQTSSSAPKPL